MSKSFFTEKRSRLGPRKKGNNDPKPNSFLIVSEGEKTEPLYFQGLADHINGTDIKRINAVEKPTIDPEGIGRSTVKLVSEAKKLVARGKIHYSQVWIVFDKDDFQDFDEAIRLAQSYGYHVAWNNRSFEFWIFLHFHYSDSDLNQNDWVEKISEIFKREGINPNGYQKNDKDVFTIATTKGSLKEAVKRAERIEKLFPTNLSPSRCSPCTKVHKLIKELEHYLTDLLK